MTHVLDVAHVSPLWDGRGRVQSLHPAQTAVARTQSNRYTGVPFATALGNHSADAIEMRTQPWEAGYAGTDNAPWMAKPPSKYNGL